MPLPRQLNLAPEIEDKLVSWLETELVNHLAEREERITRLERYQADYIARPSTEVGTYPFAGASTIIIPLTAIALEAVHSRTMQTLWSQKQRVAVKLKNPKVQDGLDAELENYLDDALIETMNFEKNTEGAILELQKLGTGIIETGYDEIRKTGSRYDEEGKLEEFEVLHYKGPTVDSVSNASFLMPFDCLDPQTARWCGKSFWWNEFEIRQKEKDGYFKEGTVEKFLTKFAGGGDYNSDNASNYKAKTEELTETIPAWPKDIPFYWIACSFNIDELEEDADPTEIFLVFNRETRTICACWYNWFDDLRRPFRGGVYMPLEFRWYGIGIAQQNEQFQAEVTAQHRQRLDNANIANLRMFKIKRGMQIKDNEPLFPGKYWFVDEMDDIQSLEMGDVKTSAYNNENQVVVYSQQRTGVNELTLGMPNIGTPGTAADSMSRMQESARKGDYTMRNTKLLLNQVLNDSLCNLVQWGPDTSLLQFNPLASEIEQFLQQPYDLFRKKIIMNLELVGQNQNRMLDRQNATQLTGIMQQYYTQLLTLAQQMENQELIQEISAKALIGANLAMRTILETFDMRTPDKFLITPANGNQIPAPAAAPDTGNGGTPNPSSSSSVQSNLILAPNAASIMPNIPGIGQGLG